jgi:hypothetical protein
MTEMLAKIAISILMKLITEKFLAKLVIQGLRAWSGQTANVYDDRVVEAMAQALSVDPEDLKVLVPK